MATQLAEQADAPGGEAGVAAGAAETDAGAADKPQERDYEAEARAHGWTPKDDFKGDEAKWVDAETFAKRADEVMPFLKKQNGALKREIDDLKRTIKRSSEFFAKGEERAYKRALDDLQGRHEEAVEKGDVAGARKIVKELTDLEKPALVADEQDDPKQAQREFAEWVDRNDWYVTDDKKRAYADIQAGAMGPAGEWDGGPSAWLEELGKRVSRKFAEQKPNPVNGGGNRSGAGPRGAKSFTDLPPEAKAMCDKFHRTGVFGDPAKVTLEEARKRYVADYDWS